MVVIIDIRSPSREIDGRVADTRIAEWIRGCFRVGRAHSVAYLTFELVDRLLQHQNLQRS